MAKYSLILKDSTFVRLLQNASNKGLTFGKYVNEYLNKLAENPKAKDSEVCFVCGEKPKIVVHGFNGAEIFFCKRHEQHKTLGKGWRNLEEV